MWSTPFDLIAFLIDKAVNSESARADERARIRDSLERLHLSLAKMTSAEASDVQQGRAEFSNAASDFFCQVRIFRGPGHAGLQVLEGRLEALVSECLHGTADKMRCQSLLGELDAELGNW
jgi:hypothetical protein